MALTLTENWASDLIGFVVVQYGVFFVVVAETSMREDRDSCNPYTQRSLEVCLLLYARQFARSSAAKSRRICVQFGGEAIILHLCPTLVDCEGWFGPYGVKSKNAALLVC